MPQPPDIKRRELLRFFLATGAGAMLWPLTGRSEQSNAVISKSIPSSGEALPVIGLGSWQTFNVGNDTLARDNCAQVIRHFFAGGGRMIDSSPMYGSSQEVIGYGLTKLNKASLVFATDKVWTDSNGREQLEQSRGYWNVAKFDLMQVHNLLAWEKHLPMLFDMKAAGLIRYVGITTSHGRRHGEFEKIMRNQPLDFIQVTYNIRNREVENRLLPLAQERGMAVIANMPFEKGELVDWAKRHPLPAWAQEIDCSNWAQFLLKFIVSHPAVNCAIPATSRVDHVNENMGAARGRLPDEAMRKRMINYVASL